MKKLILIDGINFFYKGAWSGGVTLTAKGEDVTYIYAFIKNLLSLINNMESVTDDCTFIICWDGGYTERLRISSEARDKGIIPKVYKQERRESYDTEDEEQKRLSAEFKRQLYIVEDLVKLTKVHNAFIKGEESDDLISSFVMSQKDKFDEIVIFTTDKDYFQLLYPNVKLFDSKNGYRGIEYLKTTYNLEKPEQWVDVGAIAGETGKSSDTIYGVPGVGYLTAAKLIAQYGTLDNLFLVAKTELKNEIEKFGNAKNLYKAVKAHEYKLKHHVKEMYVLAHEDVVDVAKQLKQMRNWLNISIPEINPDWEELNKRFAEMSFHIGTHDLDVLTKTK